MLVKLNYYKWHILLVFIILAILFQAYNIKTVASEIVLANISIENKKNELKAKDASYSNLQLTKENIETLKSEIAKIKISPYPDIPSIITNLDDILNNVDTNQFQVGIISREGDIFFQDYSIAASGSLENITNTLQVIENSFYHVRTVSLATVANAINQVSFKAIVRVYFMNQYEPKKSENITPNFNNPFYYEEVK